MIRSRMLVLDTRVSPARTRPLVLETRETSTSGRVRVIEYEVRVRESEVSGVIVSSTCRVGGSALFLSAGDEGLPFGVRKLSSQCPCHLDAGHNQYTMNTLPIEMAEMPAIAGPKVGATCADCAGQNWNILLGQPFRSLFGHLKCLGDFDPAGKPIQAGQQMGAFTFQIPSHLFPGVGTGHQGMRRRQVFQHLSGSACGVACGKQYIGVQKDFHRRGSERCCASSSSA